jgi:dextranase
MEPSLTMIKTLKGNLPTMVGRMTARLVVACALAATLMVPLVSRAQGPLIYGYLSHYPAQSSAVSSNEVAWLHQYHINYVQFYDWQSRHHWPLAGTVASPAANWGDIANRTTYRQTVNDLLASCHMYGMKAMAYNLLYGAYANYATDGSGVNPEWGLYDSAGGAQWSVSMPGGWATSALVMFNPDNSLWQNYLFNRENDMFAAYDFDGWHVDQLGDPGSLKYDYYGKPVDVWPTFVNFLNNARSATSKSIIFNNVAGYGMFSVCNQTANDAVYVECWENGQTTYNDLKAMIDNGLDWGIGKPVVLAAYVNRGKTSGSFNAPGVLLCDAAIFASGGTHLELGDGGHMLNTEYFPNQTLTLSASLANTLTNYYNFIINYKRWLYGGLANSSDVIALSVPGSDVAAPNRVWAFAKAGGCSKVLNLINLIGESSINWRDTLGTYPAPTPQLNFTAKYYYGYGTVGSVQLASPDFNNGAAMTLPFATGTDAGGDYVQFTVPRLDYWDMIVLGNESIVPPPQLVMPEMSDGRFQFSLATLAGQPYTVWATTNLATTGWNVRTNFIGNGDTNRVLLSIPANVSRQFYRVSQP